MIKKLVILCAAVASFQTYACQVAGSSAYPKVEEALDKNGWDFDNYDVICEKLRKANAALLIVGNATVLGNY